jgi:hypothetical protein
MDVPVEKSGDVQVLFYRTVREGDESHVVPLVGVVIHSLIEQRTVEVRVHTTQGTEVVLVPLDDIVEIRS